MGAAADQLLRAHASSLLITMLGVVGAMVFDGSYGLATRWG
jgi:hypothetical protein